MNEKIYTQYEMDEALERESEVCDEACEEAYESGLAAGRNEAYACNEAGTQNGVMPLRGENLTDCALFILAKKGNRNPSLGEVVTVEGKLQEAGI